MNIENVKGIVEKVDALNYGKPEHSNEITFNEDEISFFGGIETKEKKSQMFYNMYGDYPRFFAVYRMGFIWFNEGHMRYANRLHSNLQRLCGTITSITLKKYEGYHGKVEVQRYTIERGSDGTKIEFVAKDLVERLLEEE